MLFHFVRVKSKKEWRIVHLKSKSYVNLNLTQYCSFKRRVGTDLAALSKHRATPSRRLRLLNEQYWNLPPFPVFRVSARLFQKYRDVIVGFAIEI
jgi:hypothetical protein